jgi:nucleoside 2-deoxyribosyltransferase
MVIYIAGPITGVENYRKPFELAEKLLEEQGHTVLTPIVHPEGLTRGQYMRMCLAMIDSADAVYFLDGWEKSDGATIEHAYSVYVRKIVFHESDID